MQIPNKINVRRVAWSVVIILAIYTFTFSPSVIQSRNMKQAHREIAAVKKILEKDARFSNVKFACSTASLGKLILVRHSCDNEKDLQTLKDIISSNFDSKYEFIYAPNQNSMKDK